MSELHALLEVLGEDATLKLVEHHGGTRVHVPTKIERKHHLRSLLGEKDFRLLFRHFAGEDLDVPIARRWRYGIYERQNKTPKEMARLLHCAENTVYAYRRGEKRPSGQLLLNLEEGG